MSIRSSKPLSSSEAKVLFSEERLENLKQIYSLNDSQSVIVHEALNELSGAIFASLSIFEIQFRNMTVSKLILMFGNDWISKGPFSSDDNLKSKIGSAKQKAHNLAYSKITSKSRLTLRHGLQGNAKRINANAAKKVPVSNGDVVAQFTLGFWRTLFSKTYEPSLWNFGLRNIFPDKAIRRGQVSDHLETILKVRNRVAHHEFIHIALCRKYISALNFISREMRMRGVVRNLRVHDFQRPYIMQVELQLHKLEHLLNNCKN